MRGADIHRLRADLLDRRGSSAPVGLIKTVLNHNLGSVVRAADARGRSLGIVLLTVIHPLGHVVRTRRRASQVQVAGRSRRDGQRTVHQILVVEAGDGLTAASHRNVSHSVGLCAKLCDCASHCGRNHIIVIECLGSTRGNMRVGLRTEGDIVEEFAMLIAVIHPTFGVGGHYEVIADLGHLDLSWGGNRTAIGVNHFNRVGTVLQVAEALGGGVAHRLNSRSVAVQSHSIGCLAASHTVVNIAVVLAITLAVVVNNSQRQLGGHCHIKCGCIAGVGTRVSGIDFHFYIPGCRFRCHHRARSRILCHGELGGGGCAVVLRIRTHHFTQIRNGEHTVVDIGIVSCLIACANGRLRLVADGIDILPVVVAVVASGISISIGNRAVAVVASGRNSRITVGQRFVATVLHYRHYGRRQRVRGHHIGKTGGRTFTIGSGDGPCRDAHFHRTVGRGLASRGIRISDGVRILGITGGVAAHIHRVGLGLRATRRGCNVGDSIHQRAVEIPFDFVSAVNLAERSGEVHIITRTNFHQGRNLGENRRVHRHLDIHGNGEVAAGADTVFRIHLVSDGLRCCHQVVQRIGDGYFVGTGCHTRERGARRGRPRVGGVGRHVGRLNLEGTTATDGAGVGSRQRAAVRVVQRDVDRILRQRTAVSIGDNHRVVALLQSRSRIGGLAVAPIVEIEGLGTRGERRTAGNRQRGRTVGTFTGLVGGDKCGCKQSRNRDVDGLGGAVATGVGHGDHHWQGLHRRGLSNSLTSGLVLGDSQVGRRCAVVSGTDTHNLCEVRIAIDTARPVSLLGGNHRGGDLRIGLVPNGNGLLAGALIAAVVLNLVSASDGTRTDIAILCLALQSESGGVDTVIVGDRAASSHKLIVVYVRCGHVTYALHACGDIGSTTANHRRLIIVHCNCEGTGGRIAGIIRGSPSHIRHTNLECHTIEVARMGGGSTIDIRSVGLNQAPCQSRRHAAVVGGGSIPVSAAVQISIRASIRILNLVADGCTVFREGGYLCILHPHREGTGGSLAGSVRGGPSHRRRADVELDTVERVAARGDSIGRRLSVGQAPCQFGKHAAVVPRGDIPIGVGVSIVVLIHICRFLLVVDPGGDIVAINALRRVGRVHIVRVAADARILVVDNRHHERAAGGVVAGVRRGPRHRRLADQERLAGERAARAAVDGRPVLVSHRPRHHGIHAAVVLALHIPCRAAVRVVVLVVVAVHGRAADRSTGRTRVHYRLGAVVDARGLVVLNIHREGTGGCPAGSVGGRPCHRSLTDVQLGAVQRGAAGGDGISRSVAVLQAPCQCRGHAAVVPCRDVPCRAAVRVVVLVCIRVDLPACRDRGRDVVAIHALARVTRIGRVVRVAADARILVVDNRHHEGALGKVARGIRGSPRHRGLADEERLAGERAARAAVDGRPVLVSHRPRHHGIHAAVVLALHIPCRAAVRVVVLVVVAVDGRTANGFTGRARVHARLAVVDARLARVGHRHRELAGVDVADRVGGIPSDRGGADVELLAVQGRVGSVNRRRHSHHLVVQGGYCAAVVRGRCVPHCLGFVVCVITLFCIVVFRLVSYSCTGDLRRRHILHNHVEGTFRVVTGGIRGLPRHQGGAVVELLARK